MLGILKISGKNSDRKIQVYIQITSSRKNYTVYCEIFAIHNSSLIPELPENSRKSQEYDASVYACFAIYKVYFLCCMCKWLSYHSRSFLWLRNYSRDRIITN